MKKSRVFSMILAIALLISIITPGVHAVEPNDSAVASGCSTLHAKVPLGGSEKKLETAKAAILYELNSGSLIYSWNPDARINPTGLTKLLTVLIALEEGNLDSEVTVQRSTLNTVEIGAVSAKLKSQEIISLRNLLYCIMVSSANDAAAVVAEFIAGTQENFVSKMNAKAKELGCANTHFTDVHGLDSEGQYSTARDLAIITEAALKNPTFSEMFSAKEYTVPATNKSDARVLKTTNFMMREDYTKTHYDARVTGGKPAAATLTDRSMICTAEVGTSRFLCVVVSAVAKVSENGLSVLSFGNFEETKVLLDFGFRGFSVRQVIDSNQSFAQYPVTGGENDVVVRPSTELKVVLPVDFELKDLVYDNIVDAKLLNAPIQKGDVLGSVQIRYRSVVLGSCDLVAMNPVVKEGSVILPAPAVEADEKVEKSGTGTMIMWICIAAGIVVVLAVLILVSVRLIRNAKVRKAHRRRTHSRRRSQ